MHTSSSMHAVISMSWPNYPTARSCDTILLTLTNMPLVHQHSALARHASGGSTLSGEITSNATHQR